MNVFAVEAYFGLIRGSKQECACCWIHYISPWVFQNITSIPTFHSTFAGRAFFYHCSFAILRDCTRQVQSFWRDFKARIALKGYAIILQTGSIKITSDIYLCQCGLRKYIVCFVLHFSLCLWLAAVFAHICHILLAAETGILHNPHD